MHGQLQPFLHLKFRHLHQLFSRRHIGTLRNSCWNGEHTLATPVFNWCRLIECTHKVGMGDRGNTYSKNCIFITQKKSSYRSLLLAIDGPKFSSLNLSPTTDQQLPINIINYRRHLWRVFSLKFINSTWKISCLNDILFIK